LDGVVTRGFGPDVASGPLIGSPLAEVLSNDMATHLSHSWLAGAVLMLLISFVVNKTDRLLIR
jgi:hypothetical protein